MAQEVATRGPLHGGWRVTEFTSGGQAVVPLASDKERWKAIFVTDLGASKFPRRFVQAQAMDDSRTFFTLSRDDAAGTLALAPRATDPKAPPPKLVFKVQTPDPAHLKLEGDLQGAKVSITLSRIDPASYLLVNRGFHWVNDFPFNR